MRAIVRWAVLDYLSAVYTPAASVHTQDETTSSMSFPTRASRLWQRAPLYLRIVLALILGVLVGMALGSAAGGLGLPGRTRGRRRSETAGRGCGARCARPLRPVVDVSR